MVFEILLLEQSIYPTTSWSNQIFLVTISHSESHFVVSDSLQPHGLYNSWNSPGQNTRVGSLSDSLQPQGLYNSWNSPGQNTRVGSLSFHQGIIPTQESNLDLLHCREIIYSLSHQGIPLQYSWASLVAQLIKSPPAMRETLVWSLGWEDPLEKGKTTHSSILAWRIPWIV